MSNLYSKFAQMKRNSEPNYMSFSQTPWINGEKSNENKKQIVLVLNVGDERKKTCEVKKNVENAIQ